MTIELICGDCLVEMRKMPSNSIETCITDPPAGISFMNAKWDSDKGGRDQWIAWLTSVLEEVYRVMKPGGALVIWAIPRTSHWTGTAVENAGFRIIDVITHLFGSGFPKSTSISKQIDKAAGAEREVVSRQKKKAFGYEDRPWKHGVDADVNIVTAPATDAAKLWDGWGTSLKPAAEFWWLAYKPREGTFANNALKWGVAGLNIDGARVGTSGGTMKGNPPKGLSKGIYGNGINGPCDIVQLSAGRWPSNLILDDEAARLLDQTVGELKSGAKHGTYDGWGSHGIYSKAGSYMHHTEASSGGPSRFYKVINRFFYCGKSSRRERNAGLDSTRTIKYNMPKIGGISCKDASTVLVQLLRRATSESTTQWNTDESGESIMGLCHEDSLSTTLTAINRITESKILHSWTHLPISDSTAAANCEMASGGSHVMYVENSSQSTKTTGISQEKDTLCMADARNAISELWSMIGDGANWQPLTNTHNTVKPVALMEYLCTLTKTPTGGMVLDPFAGSFSTAVACVKTGRDFIGIEIDEDYVDIGRARVADAQLQPRLGL